MSNGLGGITNSAIRDTIATKCITNIALANDAAATQDIEWTVVGTHSIDGEWQTDLAVDTGLDLSAMPAAGTLLDRDGVALSAHRTFAARVAADGSFNNKSFTLVYLLACIGTASYIIDPSRENASQDYNVDQLVCPAGYCPVGAIKIVFAVTADAFTLGTTALTGVTGQTVTYHNLDGSVPAAL